ncbi:MAG: hypothetical protein KatS3mg010_1526 [Acidimicrobiia bacterium]|nr:MAG: hypothetical protein KatS3mg010_1526 [Acidimicrobiia bacterium]
MIVREGRTDDGELLAREIVVLPEGVHLEPVSPGAAEGRRSSSDAPADLLTPTHTHVGEQHRARPASRRRP